MAFVRVHAAILQPGLIRFVREGDENKSADADPATTRVIAGGVKKNPFSQLVLRKEIRRLQLYCNSTTMTSVASWERYLSNP